MKGSFFNFFERPIFCVLFVVFVVLYGYTFVQAFRNSKKKNVKA